MTTIERDAIIAACNADADCSDFWAAQDSHFESLAAANYERKVDAFEAAYDKHIEEMACGDC